MKPKQHQAMKTTVIFRKFRDGEVIALFPYEIADHNGAVSSYMHVGQHSGADLGIIQDTKPASPEEYGDLAAELRSIGYDLSIRRRVDRRLYAIKFRLQYLRNELRNERISYAELAELQSLARYIDPGDTELLGAAGVPEFNG
jgi:hypothetical protein